MFTRSDSHVHMIGLAVLGVYFIYMLFLITYYIQLVYQCKSEVVEARLVESTSP